MLLSTGLTSRRDHVVEERITAHAMGNPGVHVLATPALIGLFEIVAAELALTGLEPGQATVGTVVNVRHLAATPLGMKFTVAAELVEIDRRRLVFKVEAHDEVERIAEGTHERFVVDMGRFLEGLKAKGG